MVLLRWSVGAVDAGSEQCGAAGGARFGVLRWARKAYQAGLRRLEQGSCSWGEGRWGWQEAGWASEGWASGNLASEG
jgi:hypothetical protein